MKEIKTLNGLLQNQPLKISDSNLLKLRYHLSNSIDFKDITNNDILTFVRYDQIVFGTVKCYSIMLINETQHEVLYCSSVNGYSIPLIKEIADSVDKWYMQEKHAKIDYHQLEIINPEILPAKVN